MLRLKRSMWADLRRLLTRRISLPLPTVSQAMAGASILGLIGLSFLFGTAVMFFRLPPSVFLDNAFTGAKAWHERGLSQDSSVPGSRGMAREGVLVDRPDKTYDGFTLFTTTLGARARLIDMRGNVVHQWELPFRRAWPEASHVKNPLADEQIHWFRCHLYPNGDLLAIYHTELDTPYGYGLVKLNKDSQLLWAYAGNVHHDIDVAEDGTLYTLSQKIESKPPEGMEFLPSPYIADSLVVLSPEGREVKNIPIVEAFRNSPYARMAALIIGGSSPLAISPPPGVRPPPTLVALSPVGPSGQLTWKGDFLHANSVKVLSRALAPKFPLFKAGQVLISLRNLDALAVVDTRLRSVVWAAQGIWRIQHDPEFLENGHLLLYDNAGSPRGCRILEYDPVTQAIPWAYDNENSTPFSPYYRGTKQRLPNGNTLIVDPDNARLLEVTKGKELVWELFCPGNITALNGARRYGPRELTFLNGIARPRP